jgi:O-antigen/teichoic acid export membrane protein
MALIAFDSNTLKRAFMGISALYVIGIPLMFLSNIALARALDVEAFGTFGFALALATFFSIPVVSGLPLLLTREVSGYIQNDRLDAYRGILRSAHAWVLMFSTVIVLAGTLWVWLTKSADAVTIFLALCLVPLFGMNAIRGGIMRGLGHPVLSELLSQIVQPTLLIIGFVGLQLAGQTSTNVAMACYVAATAIVFVMAYVIMLRKQPLETRNIAPDFGDKGRWLRMVLPFAGMNAIWILNAQIAILMLGFAGLDVEVAAMRVADRAAMLISLPLMFVNTSLGPHIVKLYQSEETLQLRQILRLAARLALLGGLPVALILCLGGHWIISVSFGSDYAKISYHPLIILVLAQTISICFGPAGIALVMTGHEYSNLMVQIAGLVTTIMVSFFAIPVWGAAGAALGVACGLVFASGLAFVTARRHLYVSTLPI